MQIYSLFLQVINMEYNAVIFSLILLLLVYENILQSFNYLIGILGFISGRTMCLASIYLIYYQDENANTSNIFR